jgi:hypothetical protein
LIKFNFIKASGFNFNVNEHFENELVYAQCLANSTGRLIHPELRKKRNRKYSSETGRKRGFKSTLAVFLEPGEWYHILVDFLKTVVN